MLFVGCSAPALASAQQAAPAAAATPAKTSPTPAKPDYPPIAKVTEGYEKVVSTADGAKSFYTIWKRSKDQQLLAELPRDFSKQRHYIALTVASGESFAGLQAGESYVYWRQYGKRLALVEPNLDIRSTGDNESKSSIKRLFTDRVILDVPIVTMVPKGGPVIDLDALLVENADKFFGYSARGLKKNLVSIKTAKAFPENVEIALEVPGSSGQLRTFHYSISLIKENKNYKPRPADERVGFFTTTFKDFGKFSEEETIVRYINRWHLEKADPKLKLSPPKEPIVFYIEHTTPIRYRRWVREGVLMWNKAFEKVGLLNAIEVRQQDAVTKAHMEKDPEDVRYNFVRWLSNGIGTAIGPSRVNPTTGQILDADIILTDGWIRHFWMQYHEMLPEVAMEGYSPETMQWLYNHPKWDPRVRLAPPHKRNAILTQRSTGTPPPMGGHPLGQLDNKLLGDQEFDGLALRGSQKNGLCTAANCKIHGLGLRQMMLAAQAAEAEAAKAKKKEEEKKKADEKAKDNKDKEDKKGKEAEKAKDEKDAKKGEDTEKKEEKKDPAPGPDEEQMIDGVPESFIGPLLADLVAHEVGHTIGLRHNFKASAIYTIEEINSEKIKGKKPFTSSVMDYIPVNINVGTGKLQGDYAMIGIGPYDEWAVEYGYHISGDAKKILSRSTEPELAYATDEDTWGPDPLARRYDFGKDPHTYAMNQMRLIKKNREAILDTFVKDGDSWARARKGYELTLSAQVRALAMMANWVGGTYVHRVKKGDPNGKPPIEVTEAAKQRAALQFVIDNGFDEKSYGLTPKLLQHMTLDKWWNDIRSFSITEDPAWPVHDRILGIQASLLTSLMRPSTLEQIYDNEFRVPANQDAFTIPELLGDLKKAIWGDLAAEAKKKPAFTARQPMISSLRRNLQKEYVERLIDLASPESGLSVGEKPIQDLAAMQLEEIKTEVAKVKDNAQIDPYSKAHLLESSRRIQKALDAIYVVDVN